MKRFRILWAVAIVLVAMSIPSISSAQYSEQRLDKFLSQRPDLKRELERNPSLIYNKAYRKKHPDLQEFMQNHPNVWGKLKGSNRWGAYDEHHDWHEADWWHEHNPGWMNKNHPEWAHEHPEWANANNHPPMANNHPPMEYNHAMAESHPMGAAAPVNEGHHHHHGDAEHHEHSANHP
jgi:hypothetical protein